MSYEFGKETNSYRNTNKIKRTYMYNTENGITNKLIFIQHYMMSSLLLFFLNSKK